MEDKEDADKALALASNREELANAFRGSIKSLLETVKKMEHDRDEVLHELERVTQDIFDAKNRDCEQERLIHLQMVDLRALEDLL